MSDNGAHVEFAVGVVKVYGDHRLSVERTMKHVMMLVSPHARHLGSPAHAVAVCRVDDGDGIHHVTLGPRKSRRIARKSSQRCGRHQGRGSVPGGTVSGDGHDNRGEAVLAVDFDVGCRQGGSSVVFPVGAWLTTRRTRRTRFGSSASSTWPRRALLPESGTASSAGSCAQQAVRSSLITSVCARLDPAQAMADAPQMNTTFSSTSRGPGSRSSRRSRCYRTNFRRKSAFTSQRAIIVGSSARVAQAYRTSCGGIRRLSSFPPQSSGRPLAGTIVSTGSPAEICAESSRQRGQRHLHHA